MQPIHEHRLHYINGFAIFIATTIVFAMEFQSESSIESFIYAVDCTLIAIVLSYLWNDMQRPVSRSTDVGRLFAYVLSFAVCAIVLANVLEHHVPEWLLVLQILFLLVVGLLSAMLTRTAASPMWDEESLPVLMVGADTATALLAQLLQHASAGHVRVLGLLAKPSEPHDGTIVAGFPVLGEMRDAARICDDYRIHGIEIRKIIARTSDDNISEMRRFCWQRDIDWQELDLGIPLPPPAPLSGPASGKKVVADERFLGWKRVFDVSFATLTLLMLLPLLAGIYAVVLAVMGRPGLFWQRRLGRDGKSFDLYKFRTLLDRYDHHGNKRTDIGRIHWLGTWLRLTHLDELPQLYNVIIGDMSLVGPRPLLPVDQPVGPTLRLDVRPGLTGLAQLRGGQKISATQKAIWDDEYVRSMSFGGDMAIIWETIKLLLLRGGSRDPWMGDASERNFSAERNIQACRRKVPARLHHRRMPAPRPLVPVTMPDDSRVDLTPPKPVSPWPDRVLNQAKDSMPKARRAEP